MPNPTVEIAGVDRTNKTKTDSVSIRRSLSDRSSMQISLIERSGVYRPSVFQEIIVEELTVAGSPGSAVRRFAGYIEEIEERPIPGRVGNIAYSLQCTDYTRLLDWRVYAGSFDIGVAFRDVVTAIFDAKLSNDGLTLGDDIPNGPVLTVRIQDGLRPISEWFRKLATETGYLFRIDENKVLRFGPLATSPPNPAPFSVTFGSLNWRDMSIRRRVGDYRNRQYARTEYTVTGELTKTFTGDGTTADFFQDDGPFHGAPTATLDSVPLSLGRMGFDGDGFDAYYDVEGWGLHFLTLAPFNNTPPPNGDILELTYRVRFQNTSVDEDAAEIAARAADMDNSGVIEAIHEDRYIDSKAGLDGRIAALLRQFGDVPTEVEFETDSSREPDSDDLEPGHSLSINLTDGPSNVNDSFLVESIESRWKASAREDVWIHRIRCTDLEPYGQRNVAPIEKLAEAVRIGPDISTLETESPEPATGAIVQLDITADTTIAAPTGISEGGEIEYQLTQTGSPLGGWVVSWNAVFKGVNSSTVQQGDGLTTIIRFRRIGSSFLMLFNSGGMEI